MKSRAETRAKLLTKWNTVSAERLPEDGVWDLCDLDFHGADFREFDLRGVKFNGANLNKVDFTDADLTGADLTDADLVMATLRKTELFRTIVKSADLTGIRFATANQLASCNDAKDAILDPGRYADIAAVWRGLRG